jgi:hypothetical protein
MTPNKQQLYFSENMCVLSCPLPYTEDLTNTTCVRETVNMASPYVIILLILIGIALILVIISCIVSKNNDISFEQLYAYF